MPEIVGSVTINRSIDGGINDSTIKGVVQTEHDGNCDCEKDEEIKGKITPTQQMGGGIKSRSALSADLSNEVNGRGSGNDYLPLINKPKVNGVTLVNDKSFHELGRDEMINMEIKNIIDRQFDAVFGGN